MADNLDSFLPSVATPDVRQRLKAYEELVGYLSQENCNLKCQEMERLVDSLCVWISSSNFKVSLGGLEVISLLIFRLEENFQPYVVNLLPTVVDRLGDHKDQVYRIIDLINSFNPKYALERRRHSVKIAAQDLLIKLMYPVSSPQFVFERITYAFTHKLAKVREEMLLLLQRVLREFGAKNLLLSKLLTIIVRLLDDQNIAVRDQASITIVVMYQYAGERLRNDLGKKNVKQSKLLPIYAKMDEVNATGDMYVCEVDGDEDIRSNGGSRAVSNTSSLRSSVRPTTSAVPSIRATTPSSIQSSKRPASAQSNASSSSSASALGVDEEAFIKQFHLVPKVNIYVAKDLTDRMNKIRDTLSDPAVDWNKRVNAMKELRGCMLAGARDYAEFLPLLSSLENSFQQAVRDLRSQVVREACITTAFLAQELGKDLGRFAETVLPALITMIPNSAKVVALSATVCMRFIIQHCHVSRLVPLVTCNLTSKSSIIRRQCCEFVHLLLHTWPTHTLDKHCALLQEAIKRGLSDADSDARSSARKAYGAFRQHFKDQADVLLKSLDASKQRQLMGEISNSSSSASINSVDRNSVASSSGSKGPATSRSSFRYSPASSSSSGVGRSTTGSTSHHRRGSYDRYSTDRGESISAMDLLSLTTTPLSTRTSHRTPVGPQSSSNYNSLRRTHQRTGSYSTKHSSGGATGNTSLTMSYDESALKDALQSASSSASDLLDIETSSVCSARSTAKRPGRIPIYSAAPRQRKTSVGSACGSQLSSGVPSVSDTRSRNRTKMGSSQSQLSYTRSRNRTKMGSSQSQPGSRSNSPASKYSYLSYNQPDVNGSSRFQSRGLVPRSQNSSREPSPNRFGGRERRSSGSSVKQSSRQTPGSVQRAMSQGEDIMSSALGRRSSSGRSSRDGYESDDMSETSSVCSADQVLRTYPRQLTEDVVEIMAYMSSSGWSDRRDGLLALHSLLRSGRTLTKAELKRVTDVFTRMFHDPHGKVFGMFLDVLVALITVHHEDLCDWLYVVITRLITKTGADMLGSVHAKILKAIDVVRSTFQPSFQFSLAAKFIIDQTQTPNLKVKVSLLEYMSSLVQLMQEEDFINTSDIRLAVSRIITWTTEPKSVDVRKAAQSVLVGLSDLSSSEFNNMLLTLPKTFQDGAKRALAKRPRSTNHDRASAMLSSGSMGFRYRTSSGGGDYNDTRRLVGARGAGLDRLDYGDGRRHLNNSRGLDFNEQEICNSIKQMSDDIHGLVHGGLDDTAGVGPVASKGSTALNGVGRGGGGVKGGAYGVIDGQGSANRSRGYHESIRNDNNMIQSPDIDQISSTSKTDSDMEEGESGDVVQDILIELSNHNERYDERRAALIQLMKKTREESSDVWDEYFNAVLLMLLETLGDNDGQIRTLALRVLAEFLRCHSDRFGEYAELTMVRTLESHRDPVKEVTRAAEECISILAKCLSADRCVKVLRQVIESEDYPVNMAAIKMLTLVVEASKPETVMLFIPSVMPGVIKNYDDPQSCVRKACVVCMVSMYMSVGKELRPFLSDLSSSKTKLLNVYIKRALDRQQGTNSSATSQTASPISLID